MSTPALLRRSVMVVAAAAALVGTTVALGNGSPSAPVELTPAAAEPPQPAPPDDIRSVSGFFVRDDGTRLVLEERAIEVSDRSDQDGLAVALTHLLEAEPVDGLSSMVPAGTRLLTLEVVEGVAIIDVSEEIGRNPGFGGEAEVLLAQQLAHTAAAAADVEAIRLSIEGQLVDELWGHLDWSMPITPEATYLAN